MGFIDLSGQQIYDWYVENYAGNRLWNCRCSCGTTRQVRGELLRSGRSKSCGHTKDPNYLINKHIGQWEVLKYNGNSTFQCRCSCGAIKDIRRDHLLDGTSTSCGHKQGIYICTVDKEQFKTQVQQVIKKHNRKLTLHELSNELGLAYSTTVRLVRQYDCTSYIDLSKNQSIFEQQVLDYITTITKSKYVLHDRNILQGQELDVYFPIEHIAIECNGSYWHCDLNKSSDYHQKKTLLCRKAGIRLIHIFDYEWYNNEDKIKNLLATVFGNNTIVYARNTTVKYITNVTESKNFLAANHLQEYVPAQHSIGLYFNDELIEIMTFGTPRFSTDSNFELLRLCTKQGYTVIGGASKLFKFATNYLKGSIVTYCDLSKFDGKVYEQLGMTLCNITAPNYVYVDLATLETLSRYSCQKQKLLKKNYGTADMTEGEIMAQLGYVRLYNSGNACYKYNT